MVRAVSNVNQCVQVVWNLIINDDAIKMKVDWKQRQPDTYI